MLDNFFFNNIAKCVYQSILTIKKLQNKARVCMFHEISENITASEE